jgi:hypothetical protein
MGGFGDATGAVGLDGFVAALVAMTWEVVRQTACRMGRAQRLLA